MKSAINFYRCNSRALNGGQQYPAQGIPDRRGKSSLQWLTDRFPGTFCMAVLVYFQSFRNDKLMPISVKRIRPKCHGFLLLHGWLIRGRQEITSTFQTISLWPLMPITIFKCYSYF